MRLRHHHRFPGFSDIGIPTNYDDMIAMTKGSTNPASAAAVACLQKAQAAGIPFSLAKGTPLDTFMTACGKDPNAVPAGTPAPAVASTGTPIYKTPLGIAGIAVGALALIWLAFGKKKATPNRRRRHHSR